MIAKLTFSLARRFAPDHAVASPPRSFQSDDGESRPDPAWKARGHVLRVLEGLLSAATLALLAVWGTVVVSALG